MIVLPLQDQVLSEAHVNVERPSSNIAVDDPLAELLSFTQRSAVARAPEASLPFALLKLKPTTPGVNHERRSAPCTPEKSTPEKYEASGCCAAESVIEPSRETALILASKAASTVIVTPSAAETLDNG